MNRARFWWQYLRKKTPWDTRIVPPEIVTLAGTLSPGRALDIGCGTGTTSIYLAERGWEVVGIDFVGSAIYQARRKAEKAHAQVQFFVSSATHLEFLSGVFDLVIDIGCLHSLGAIDQHAYSTQLKQHTRSGTVYALYAFGPRLMKRRKIGLTIDQIRTLFAPEFNLESWTFGKDKGIGPESGWYYLRCINDFNR